LFLDKELDRTRGGGGEGGGGGKWGGGGEEEWGGGGGVHEKVCYRQKVKMKPREQKNATGKKVQNRQSNRAPQKMKKNKAGSGDTRANRK